MDVPSAATGPTTQQQDEAHLMDALAAGDPGALEILYDRYGAVALTATLRIVRDRLIAEEVLQECFLRVWRNAGQFDGSRGQVRSWILRIAHNVALNELRSQRRRPLVAEPAGRRDAGSAEPEDALAAIPDTAPLTEDLVWIRDRQRHLRAALAQLPEVQRSVLELYAQGHSQSEIAERLGDPLGTVKTRMRRGLIALRDQLQDLDIDPY